ncbi:sulfur carrier protein ThiS [Nocardioides ferulae]|uniref:sulfur carrier protein ThiS n=1 Tax=Nocardioides ferulae TaxID=2340821 RepID=UPI000EAC1ABD|nr:sulfur carrier protein ThiS [Nocardioides ferulae]
MTTIRLNGEVVAVTAVTVADLLALRLDHRRPSGVAVAVNAQVVPRDDWSRHALVDGDVVELVTAVQGG